MAGYVAGLAYAVHQLRGQPGYEAPIFTLLDSITQLVCHEGAVGAPQQGALIEGEGVCLLGSIAQLMHWPVVTDCLVQCINAKNRVRTHENSWHCVMEANMS